MAKLTPQSLTNCTCNLSPEQEFDQVTYNDLILTADTGCSFFNVANNVRINTATLYTFSWFIDEGRTTRATQDNMTGVVKLYAQIRFSSGNNASLTATAIKTPITQNLSFCTSNIPTDAVPGLNITTILTADRGYEFKSLPTMSVPDGRGSRNTLSCTLSSNNTVATFDSYTILMSTDSIIISGTAEPSESISDIYPFISVYAPTDSQLIELSKKRFYTVSSGEGSTIDLGQYIVNLIKIFAPVKTGLPATIKLWNYDTQVTSDVVIEQEVQVDLGTAYIPDGYITNSQMLSNSQLKAYLPFLGLQQLDLPSLIGHRDLNTGFNCVYHVDVLTGDCTILLKTDNMIIETYECNVSIQVPYIISNYNIAYRGDVKTNSKAFMPRTPYLILEMPQECYESSWSYPVSWSGLLKDMPDTFVQTDLPIQFSFTAPKDDLDEIESLLSQGVWTPTSEELQSMTG